MSTTATIALDSPPRDARPSLVGRVGGPVRAGWREGTLTRAAELESLSAWVCRQRHASFAELAGGVGQHLQAAREAAEQHEPWFRISRNAALIERATSNLDAAEAQLLNIAPPDYLVGQMPSLLSHVQRHLVQADPRRQELERIAQRIGMTEPTGASAHNGDDPAPGGAREAIEKNRGRIITAVRGASSAALRERLRVRSFRNALVATTLVMTFLAVCVAVLGWISPTTVPICFQPERSGQTVVVCPTAQSALVTTTGQSGPVAPDVDDAVQQTAAREDLLTVELVGLIAAAVAAAAAIRGIRGSSERCGLPVAIAALKLPTGAITAFLGLLLMRGQFVPGLSALDTSAQILAWALVFGYAQQLFTRLVDRQAHTVLDNVRGADNAANHTLRVTP